MKDIHQKAIRYLTYLVLNNLQSHLLKRGPCLFTTRAHLPKRHNSSCYNTVHHVKHLDNGLTFMPVQCVGVIFILFSFYTQIYLSTMYGVQKTPTNCWALNIPLISLHSFLNSIKKLAWHRYALER